MQRTDGDVLPITVPLDVLTKIQINPALSPAKMRAIRQMTYDPSTKVLAHARRRHVHRLADRRDLLSGR